MTRRDNAIRATVSMNIAISETLLVFSKNYLEALRYVLYWLKEKRINPNKGNIIGIKCFILFLRGSIFLRKLLKIVIEMRYQYTKVGIIILIKEVFL